MYRFLQLNLNRSGLALNLLHAMAAETRTQVLLVSEQPRGPPDSDRKVSSQDNDCAVLVVGDSFHVEASGAGPGFAWMEADGTRAYSCYLSPNSGLEEFRGRLEQLELSIRRAAPALDIIVAGDFNAKSYDWGSSTEDARGVLLTETLASLGMVVANVGDRPTFQRVNAESVIDVTFSRMSSGQAISNWRVMDEFSGSDHRYIAFQVSRTGRTWEDELVTRSEAQSGWNSRRMCEQKLASFLQAVPACVKGPDYPAEETAQELTELLSAACGSCMPARLPPSNRRRPVHWWSDDIAQSRRDCLLARRRYQRAARRGDAVLTEQLRAIFQQGRKALRVAIRAARERCWAELCSLVDADPWGLPYKVVCRKLRRHPPGLEARGRENQIADQLFPRSHRVEWDLVPLSVSGRVQPPPDLLFTHEELRAAARRLPAGKAPGPDGVPNELVRSVALHRPDVLLHAFNSCLGQGKFPKVWKQAKLVLLHKGGGKPVSNPSSFRPISLLNTAGKMLERLLLARLNTHLDGVPAGRSPGQFGFRSGRSTEDAIAAVLDQARAAAAGAVQNRHLCAVVSLDVKNAFNTAPWLAIDRALERKAVPAYLREMFRSYLQDRSLLVGGRLDPRPVTCGVPQGSVLGPALWNVFYDGLLGIEMPAGVRLVAFADDVAVVGTAHTGELLEQALNPALGAVASWMDANGLELAVQKTEAVVLTGKWAFARPRIILGDQVVTVRESLRYLGVTLDQRTTFTAHAGRAAKAAAESARAISRLMPNVGGPSGGRRMLLGSVVCSKLLYAAPVWAERAMMSARNRSVVCAQQRRVALRVIRAYRTVSDVAACALAEWPPVDLLALERCRIRMDGQDGDRQNPRSSRLVAAVERRRTVETWTERWRSTEKAAWTRRILPDLGRWLGKVVRVPLTFHVTQALTGHGCFQQYLFRMGRARSPGCLLCGGEEDTVEHTLLVCPFWDLERSALEDSVGGRSVTTEDLTAILCGPLLDDLPEDPRSRMRLLAAAQGAVDKFVCFVEAVLSRKETLEREREAAMRNQQAS